MTSDRAAGPQATSSLVARLYREHIRRHLGRIVFAALCMVVAAAATAANAWLLQPVMDEIFLARNHALLLLVPLAVLALAVTKGGATFVQGYLMGAVGQRIIAEIQLALYGHLMRADLAYFQNTSSGRLVSNFLNDANLLRDAVARTLTGMVKDSLTLIFLVALMFYQDWRLAAVTFVVFPLAIIPVRNLGRRVRKASTATQERTGRFAALLTETLQGARHVKAYGMEDYETGRAGQAVEQRLQAVLKVVKARAAATPLMETLGGIAVAAVIYYGGSRVIAGETTPGIFFSFMAALIMAYQPLKSLANLNAALQEGLAAAQRIFAMFDVEPEIREQPGAPALEVRDGGIRFDDVSFAYGGDRPALGGVSFEVPAGQTVALVGASGAGKSTVLNLIPRFYDIGAGRLSIDGQQVSQVGLASLRAAIGLVSQEATLFDDTVRANIAYGRPGADDAAIEAAARAAAAADFIANLPQGLDTIVGESGARLSGGQRQRIAIARAMLKDAPILLLDEATSALDAESERQVQAALGTLMQGRTTLVVAHRLSTVIDADVIHVMDQGRIVESGGHAELMARGGTYARLYRQQESSAAETEAGAKHGAIKSVGARA
ncbi:MAG: ABC transporter ATP-binding protein [Alphaproteobacteria bacterium]|nr:ABC transporter ATP-binding protein [Alphaproteobacteria bacterium]HJP20782.1 ABC transporter ATP-binding protein [Alphaproteobacteria bacterium]